MKRAFSIQLCLAVVVLVFCVNADVCLAGRVELSHDGGERNVETYYTIVANPLHLTGGLAVQFQPSGFPCFVREVSVFVDSTAQFRVHLLSSGGQDLCDAATVAALEPASWATYVLPSEVTIMSEYFWVVGEISSPPDPGIGTTYEPDGGLTVYTKGWDSMGGIRATDSGNGENAMIRAVVDVPVQVERISSTQAPNDHVFITFDSPMDASTLTAGTIIIGRNQPPSIPGRYEYDDLLRRVEFTPDSLLGQGFLSVEVSAAVGDIYGNHMENPLSSWQDVGQDVDENGPAMPQNLSLQADDTITASWEAVPLGDAVGYYLYSGPWAPGITEDQWLASAEKTDLGNVVESSLLVAQKEQPYRVGVSGYDLARNEGEISFQEAVVHRGSVLLVVESPSLQGLSISQGQDQLRDSLESGAFDYNVWLEWERGGLPDEGYLNQFGVVFWSVGNRFPDQSTCGVFDRLEQFMSSGGSLFYESRMLLNGIMVGNLFFPTWLHLTSPKSNADYDAPVVVGVQGDPVGDGVELIYTTAGSKYFFSLQDGAAGFLTVKDKADEICGLRYADTGDYGYRLVFSTATLSLVYNTEDRDKLMSRGLCWLQGKQLDFRIATNTRVLEPYGVLQLFVSANTLAGVEADVDAYLAVLVEADAGSALLFYNGTGFVPEMTPFVSGVHLDSGMFLPRTKVFEYLYRGGLPSGKYTFYVALTQAGTQTFLTAPQSTVVFMR